MKVAVIGLQNGLGSGLPSGEKRSLSTYCACFPWLITPTPISGFSPQISGSWSHWFCSRLLFLSWELGCFMNEIAAWAHRDLRGASNGIFTSNSNCSNSEHGFIRLRWISLSAVFGSWRAPQFRCNWVGLKIAKSFHLLSDMFFEFLSSDFSVSYTLILLRNQSQLMKLLRMGSQGADWRLESSWTLKLRKITKCVPRWSRYGSSIEHYGIFIC